MSRRADPERIEQARRAAIIERLVGDGMIRDRAEAAVAAWEAQGGRLRSSGDSDAAYREIAAQRP